MRRLKSIVILLLAFSGSLSFSQTSPRGFFHFQSINGEIKVKGLYREQKSLIGDIKEDQKSLYYLGGIMINTASYLWNPDLISFNLDAEYNPESRKEEYLLIPDRSEVRTLKKFDFRNSIFRKKAISLNTFVNLNQTYYNRELLTNIKSDNRQWGGILALNSKFLPLSVSFRQSDWTQKEIQAERDFSMTQKNILGRISKTFSHNDTHEFLYSRDDYTYNYAGSGEISNLIDRYALNNNIYFDRNRKYNFNSQVSYYNQAGDNPFNKIDAGERLIFDLPAKFRLAGGYTYNRLEDPSQILSQNRVSGSLNHQLFESLITNISGDYSEIAQTVYDEKHLRGGFDINYTKKLGKGRINLSYRYYRSYFDVTGESVPVKTLNEEHTLSDSRITLLNKPYVDLSTLRIKDPAGIIIYQQDFDYTVTVRNNFVEIGRVPGGQITNDQLILADYTSIRPGSYSFEADNNSYGTSIQLFGKLIEFYYRGSFQNYRDLIETDFLTLDYYKQNIYGGRIDVGFAGIGAEYDNYESNIIPYQRYRYFVDLNWNLRSKLLVSVNGNIMDYKFIGDDANQQHINITGKVAFYFTYKTKLDIDVGYLSQRGKNINLDLLTSRLGISTSFRQLYFTGGLEMYSRKYLNSDFSFIGTFLEMARRF